MEPERVKEILAEIFGVTKKLNGGGVERIGGLIDLDSGYFDLGVQKVSVNWPTEFKNYFMRNKVNKFREKVLCALLCTLFRALYVYTSLFSGKC